MILYLTNAPSEILALRSIVEALPDDFPPVRSVSPDEMVVDLGPGDIVLARLLGGRQAFPGFDGLRQQVIDAGADLLAFSGEAAPDAELTAASTAPSATVAQAFEYLVHGGLFNFEQMLRFVSDTVGMTGFGFEPPAAVAQTGVYRRPTTESGPLVAVLFYRAHLIAGNTTFVDDLCDAIEASGGRAVAVWAYSLRPGRDGGVAAIDTLRDESPDAVVTTVLVSGSAADDGLAWDASAIGSLGVPVVQAVTSTGSRAE
jgi:cobaltochelatase CobN